MNPAAVLGRLASEGAGHGMHVVATTNRYTEHEDLSMADIVVNCLGEADGPQAEVRPGGRELILTDGCVHARALVELFSSKETAT